MRMRKTCRSRRDTRRRFVANASAHREGVACAWRNAFIRMPFARERTIQRASSTIRSRLRSLGSGSSHSTTGSRPRPSAAILEATGHSGEVTCRCTNVYPDGPAPYFTFHAAGRHGELIPQWHTIKSAGLDAVIANGGTVTHPTRSGATIGRGTIASAHHCLPLPSRRPRRPWIRLACSIRAY